MNQYLMLIKVHIILGYEMDEIIVYEIISRLWNYQNIFGWCSWCEIELLSCWHINSADFGRASLFELKLGVLQVIKIYKGYFPDCHILGKTLAVFS